MNDGPELKPCPFCGKNAKLISRKNWGHRVECQFCCVHSPAYRPSKEMALGEWNTRADLCLTQADLDAAVLAERERCALVASSRRGDGTATLDHPYDKGYIAACCASRSRHYEGGTNMTMRDQIAALLWRTEAVDSGTPQSLIDRRTPEAFADQSPELRGKWFKYADAILAALPGMGPDLVWAETRHKSPDQLACRSTALGINYVIYSSPKGGKCILSSCGAAYIGPLHMADTVAAKAAANAHHRAAIAKAAGWPAPPGCQ